RPAASAPADAGTDGVQAAGGAGRQPDPQGIAGAAPDDISAGHENPASVPPSATPATDASAAAGAASNPAIAAIAAAAGTAPDGGAMAGGDNPDAGPSDARGLKSAGTGAAAPAGSTAASAVPANGSGMSAGGNTPGAAKAPTGAVGGAGSHSAAQVIAGTPAAATAEAMQPAAAAPPAGDGAVAPSFQAEMRAALDAPAQAAAATSRGAVTAQPAGQVALQISRAVEQGSDRLTVHLKPAELGKVTIELDVGPDRRVTAVISAERSETLDLLQRDARSLERALNDAGLRTGAGSLEFGLQGNGDQAMRRDDGNDRTDAAMSVPGAGKDDPDGEAAAAYGPRIVPDGRVNIQV
ncbi:MAG: flagellar hook-length control protein FliK, partial [Rhodospirillaceae bacterium]